MATKKSEKDIPNEQIEKEKKPATAKKATKTTAKTTPAKKSSSKAATDKKTATTETKTAKTAEKADTPKEEAPKTLNKVEVKLRSVARLQSVLSAIDKIKTLRGELPLEVQNIEDNLAGIQTRLDNYSAAAKALSTSITNERNKISSSAELLEKYRRQLDHVRNNREYDSLSKEIEYQDLELQLSEKRIKEYTAELNARKEDISKLKETYELRTGDLAAKKGELDKIITETEAEEQRLLKEAKSLESNVEDERLLKAFYRIRNAAHNGLAVVPIDRDACGGCFNRIPPQRQLEIRLAKKIIVCEYCGRIVVDPDLFAEETK